MALRFWDVVAIAIYTLGILFLGWWTKRRVKGTEGFFVGGRSMPGWAVGMSVLATAVSSITFLAYPGSSYSGDWSRLVPGLMLPFATAIGVSLFVVFYRRSRFVSAYEYFERRYGNWGRSYASILFTLSSIWRMGYVLYLLSLPIKMFTGWDGIYVILFAGAIVTIYTMMGGLEGVIYTDVIQGSVLIIGGIITIALVVMSVPGGAPAIITDAMAAGKFKLVVSWDWDFAKLTFWGFAMSGIVGNITEQGIDQTKVQRYQAPKSDREAIKAALYVLYCIPTWIMFMFVGTCLWAYYRAFPVLPMGTASDYVYPHFILTQTPPFIGGLILVAVLSAAMATDSTMNGSASVVIEDFYKRHFAKNRTDMHYLFVARLVTWMLGVLMVLVAWWLTRLNADTILDVGFFVGSVLAGGLGGFFLIGFFFKHVNGKGALIGLISGLLMIVWGTLSQPKYVPEPFLIPDAYRLHMHEFFIGLLSNVAVFVVGIVASWFFPAPTEEELVGMTWWTRDRSKEKPLPAPETVNV